MPDNPDPQSARPDGSSVRIEPWDADGLALLQQQNTPEMTQHLGGPEPAEKLVERQARYERLADSGKGRFFKIVDMTTGEVVGSVGYWENEWHGEEIYEMGWGVLPPFQGRGIASAATAQAVASARADGKRRFLHAFPSVDNPPSNGVCRRVGFTLVEEVAGEYPVGNFIRCNDWRLDLFANDTTGTGPGSA